MGKQMYRITTDPRKRTELLVDPRLLEDSEGKVGVISVPNDCIQTGMFTEFQDIVKYISQAEIVFSMGDFDKMSIFELGVALGLNKTVYIVSLNKHLNVEDLGFSVQTDRLVFLTPEEFGKL